MVPRGSGRPSGISVARALRVPSGLAHDDVRQAIEAIERVHGVGNLPSIPIQVGRLEPSGELGLVRRGAFSFLPSGDPVRIVIEAMNAHRAFSAVHEIGHFLDYAGFGQVGRFESTRSDGLLIDWREAVGRSRAIQALIRVVIQEAGDAEAADAYRHLAVEEIWARAYAQWIAVLSGSATLLASLNEFRFRRSTGLYWPLQWDDEDFAPIEDAIESLFRRLGWRSD